MSDTDQTDFTDKSKEKSVLSVKSVSKKNEIMICKTLSERLRDFVFVLDNTNDLP